MGNKFRRGDRVWVDWGGSIRFGTVINPKPDSWDYIKVRFDFQQPWERGSTARQDQLERLTTDETQYTMRHFNLMWLTHSDMKELRDAPLSAELKAKIMGIQGFVP